MSPTEAAVSDFLVNEDLDGGLPPPRVGKTAAPSRKTRRGRPAWRTRRRRRIDPTTCERAYTEDEIEFMRAMDLYKRDNRRPFPTWSEVLEVLRALGYRKGPPAG